VFCDVASHVVSRQQQHTNIDAGWPTRYVVPRSTDIGNRMVSDLAVGLHRALAGHFKVFISIPSDGFASLVKTTIEERNQSALRG